MDKKSQRLKMALVKALRGFTLMLPVLLGVILLLGLFKAYVTSDMIAALFTGIGWRDVPVGALLGSISAGNPITSYIVGGELQDSGVGLFAVTAFIVAWVSVGVIQLPVEMSVLGKRFALLRTGLSFVFALLLAAVTVTIVEVVP